MVSFLLPTVAQASSPAGSGRVPPPGRARPPFRRFLALAYAACFCWLAPGARAQLATSPQPVVRDPLMALMLSQPRIDVESPVQPTATFDPPMAKPGERVTYRVVINALEASIQWPDKLPDTGNLQLEAGAHGQLLAMNGALFKPSTTFNYHVRPKQPGHFTVPAFSVEVYGKAVTIPTAELEVRGDLPAHLPAPAHLQLELEPTNIFVGQAVKARVYSPPHPGSVVQGLAQVQINGEGFIVDAATARPRVEATAPRAGLSGMTYIHEVLLTPMASGRLSAFAQAYSVDNRTFAGAIGTGPSIVPGQASQYTLLDSDPVVFAVKPLPHEGQPEGFTGAVGRFEVQPPQLSTNEVRVGDPVKLTVRVRGEGNLVRLVAPPPPQVRDWQVFAGEQDPNHPQIILAQGATTFTYTLVPLNEKSQATPIIPFSYFDPDQEKYVNASIPSVGITVEPGAVPVDLGVMDQARSSAAPEEKLPVLSDLAREPGLAAGSLVPLQRQPWFPLLQLAPAVAFFGLWIWKRRQQYFEAHPGVVLRRRARRALRRQRRLLGRAARDRNAPAFAAAAVGAMRVACSPHYPAEPRALVGGDVLAVLPETSRGGDTGRVVRRFFEATDGTRYGGLPEDGSELLALRPQLEHLLDHLEGRL